MSHQRKVARALKQSRSVGLISYESNWKVPAAFVYGEQSVKNRGITSARYLAGRAALIYGDSPNSEGAIAETEVEQGMKTELEDEFLSDKDTMTKEEMDEFNAHLFDEAEKK